MWLVFIFNWALFVSRYWVSLLCGQLHGWIEGVRPKLHTISLTFQVAASTSAQPRNDWLDNTAMQELNLIVLFLTFPFYLCTAVTQTVRKGGHSELLLSMVLQHIANVKNVMLLLKIRTQLFSEYVCSSALSVCFVFVLQSSEFNQQKRKIGR